MENKTNTQFFLGADTGSSKTHVLITDLTGKALGFGESGCGNYEVVGIDGMICSLSLAVDQALHTANIEKSEILSMGFGICGYDWPSEMPIMIKAVKALKLKSDFSVVNDVELGLLAGTNKGWGVAVDAGTGNNIRGRNQEGKIGRITGSSIVFGEIGGASEMVWQAMVSVAHAWTKRGPETALTQMLIRITDTDSEESMIEKLATGQLKLPPEIAKEIISIARGGDFIAQQIVKHSAQELAKNTNAVIKQINLQQESFDIVLMGSVFDAGQIFIEPFTEIIHGYAPCAIIKKLDFPPVIGAVILAAEKFHKFNRQFRQNLIYSSHRLFTD